MKRVLKYLRGTTNYGITLSCNSQDTMLAFSDADFADDINRRFSITGWVCFVNSGPITWSSKRQTVTTTSTTEAEFIALCSITKEVIWFRCLLKNLNNIQKEPTVIYCDNQRAITIVKTPASIKSTKHVEV